MTRARDRRYPVEFPYLLAAVLVAFGAGSCSKKLTGPTPAVSGVTPIAVCPAQLTQTVQLAGSQLSPLYTGALNKSQRQLELPAVSLRMAQDITGTAPTGTPTPVMIPDDPKMPTSSHVRWTSQMAMSFDVFPQLMIAPGLYAVDVTNANGHSGSFQSLLVAPPPSVSSLSSDLFCGSKENALVLMGDFFIKTAATQPTVAFTNAAGDVKTLPPSALDACLALPGGGGFEKCTRLTVTIPSGFLAVGEYTVTVTNPDPVGCKASAAVSLTIVPDPVVTKVEPDALCTADGAVQVKITGTGFLTINGTQPTVVLKSSAGDITPTGVTAAMCVPVMGKAGPTETVLTCTEITVSVPANSAGGVYGAVVTNPAPADCPSNDSTKLAIFGRPQIDKVAPAAICSKAGKTSVVLTGKNFVVVGNALPTVKVADKALVPTPAMCEAVMGPVSMLQVCSQLTIDVDPAMFTMGTQDIVVTNPMPIGCGSTAGTAKLEITMPPTIASFAPTSVCQGAATVTLTGTNFTANTTVRIDAVPAVKVTISNNGTQAVAEFAGGLALGQHDVIAENGAGCGVTAAGKITVVAGPQIFFVDPEIAYNKINVQATIYGTGFTGAVQSVTLKMGATSVPLTPVPVAGRPNQVQVTIPKDTAPGTYDLELHDTTVCAANLPNAIKVTDQKTLMLATPAVDPPFGWTMDSTAIAISAANVAGNDFVKVPRVYLNPVNPGQGAVATALGAVTFVDAKDLSALVPPGLPAGKYDVIVVNPDGKVGVAEGAFEVTAASPPAITTLSPGTVSNTNPQSFTVIGKNFRMPSVTLSCVDSAQMPLATNPTATVTMPMATSLVVTFNASVAGVACVVRVTNGDNMTYADFSALVITNPALNLTAAKAGPNLGTGRRAPVALGGDASQVARFFHVIGGDNGAGAALDSVETSPLTLLGVPNPFFVQKNKLNSARAFAGGALIGRFLYVAGGSNGASMFDTVERASVLDPNKRGAVVDLQFEIVDQGIGEGTIYYRVASIMKSTDPFNPDGENLPSDPFPVRVPNLPGNKKLNITVVWSVDPDAAKYRVYRSPMAGAAVGTEQVIGEVAAGMTSFKDTGAAPISTDTPYPVGSLGKWQTLAAKLSTPREGPGVAWGADPADATKAYLYVIGGRTSANAAAKNYDLLPITLNPDGSETVAGAFVAGMQSLVGAGRWQLGGADATARLSPRIPAGKTFIYTIGGATPAGVATSDAEAAEVTAGGQLAAFVQVNGVAGLGSNVAGAPNIAAGDLVLAFGGANAAPDPKVTSGEICATGVVGCAAKVAPLVRNFNAGQAMMVARYLSGGTLSGAFIYVAAGLTTGNAVTNTTEFRIW